MSSGCGSDSPGPQTFLTLGMRNAGCPLAAGESVGCRLFYAEILRTCCRSVSIQEVKEWRRTSSEFVHSKAILQVLHGQRPVGTNPPGVDGILVEDEASHEQHYEEHEPGCRICQDEGAGQGSNNPEQAQCKLMDEHEEEPEGEESAHASGTLPWKSAKGFPTPEDQIAQQPRCMMCATTSQKERHGRNQLAHST